MFLPFVFSALTGILESWKSGLWQGGKYLITYLSPILLFMCIKILIEPWQGLRGEVWNSPPPTHPIFLSQIH